MFNIINRKTLLSYTSEYPKAKNALFEWYYEFLNADQNPKKSTASRV